jgi:hypothetical protein
MSVEVAPDEHQGPMVLVFVHKVTRPGLGVARLIAKFTATRKEHKLQAATIFLTDDATETENWMRRAESALPPEGAIGISPDGIEGPGAYGLNRNVELTVLVANDHLVTANFALVQPSVNADVPKIMKAIAEVTGGGEVPSVESLTDNEVDLRSLLSPLIQKDATEEDVQKAAERVEQKMAENERVRRRVGEACKSIVRSGNLENYGTPAAQQYIKTWAEKYGPADRD